MASPEHLIVSKVILEQTLDAALKDEISPRLFVGEWGKTFQWILDYYTEHDIVPTQRAFHRSYGDVELLEEARSETFTGLFGELMTNYKGREMTDTWVQLVPKLDQHKDFDGAVQMMADCVERITATSSAGRAVRLWSPAEFDYSKDIDSQPLVYDMIDQGEVFLFHGDSGSHKTFIALDLALSVATGTTFLGHTTIPSAVVYLASEGGAFGFQKRVDAWCNEKAIAPPENLAVTTDAVNFCESVQVANLIKEISSFSRSVSDPIRLVVIDTLSRAMAGHDENSQSEATLFLSNVDKLVRKFGCAVVIIHHNPKKSDDFRGSTVFGDNPDGIFSAKKEPDNFIRFRNRKQRNRAEIDEVLFGTKFVEFADNAGGKQSSKVMVEVAGEDAQRVSETMRHLDLCAEYFQEHGKGITVPIFAGMIDASQSTAHRRLVQLRDRGYVNKHNIPIVIDGPTIPDRYTDGE